MAESTASSFDVDFPHFKRGDFTNFSVLAWGGEGAVEKADHNTLGCVAVRTLSHPVPLEEKKKEISILVKSKHPNIVQLFGILTDKYDRLCDGYVMEFMELGSLSAIIHNSTKEYDLNQVYLWIEQVGSGLKYLHENNIIHRHVEPQNMLLASMEHLKLAGFGISRDIDSMDYLKLDDFGFAREKDISITRGRGTCSYMAPEVIGTRRYGQPADIYSFAISIWEMIHRQKPYSEFFNPLYNTVINGKTLLDLSRIDSETEILLQRGWNKNPAERVTIGKIIEFATMKRAVNIEETGQEAKRIKIVEDQSTILIATLDKMLILSQDKSQWKALSLKLPPDHSFGSFACLNGEIFTFGAGKSRRTTFKCGHQKEWIPRADMNEGRQIIRNSTVVFESCIWVFGGCNEEEKKLNTVERYIPEENKWIQMPKMQQSRSDPAAAVCDGKIYVSGGDNDDILNSVECFDPDTKTWTKFVDLPSPLKGHSMISDGSSLIVLGGYNGQIDCNTVWKINTREENPTWKTMPSMKHGRYHFSAVSFENRIYAIGGASDTTVEIFNGESWEAGPNLSESLPVSVVIPSHLLSGLILL